MHARMTKEGHAYGPTHRCSLQRLPSPKVVPAALRLEMVVRSAALPSAAWIQSIDATYALFESAKYREQYGPLADKVRQAVQLCEEVVREFGCVETCEERELSWRVADWGCTASNNVLSASTGARIVSGASAHRRRTC